MQDNSIRGIDGNFNGGAQSATLKRLSQMHALYGAAPSGGTGPQPVTVGDHAVLDQVDLSAESLGILDKNSAPLSYYRELEAYNRANHEFQRDSLLHSLGHEKAFENPSLFHVEDRVETSTENP